MPNSPFQFLIQGILVLAFMLIVKSSRAYSRITYSEAIMFIKLRFLNLKPGCTAIFQLNCDQLTGFGSSTRCFSLTLASILLMMVEALLSQEFCRATCRLDACQFFEFLCVRKKRMASTNSSDFLAVFNRGRHISQRFQASRDDGYRERNTRMT